MNLNLQSTEIIGILDCLLGKYMDCKSYYKEHTNEEERVGVISPTEIELIYNKLLDQAQKQGECTLLKPIGNTKN